MTNKAFDRVNEKDSEICKIIMSGTTKTTNISDNALTRNNDKIKLKKGMKKKQILIQGNFEIETEAVCYDKLDLL